MMKPKKKVKYSPEDLNKISSDPNNPKRLKAEKQNKINLAKRKDGGPIKPKADPKIEYGPQNKIKSSEKVGFVPKPGQGDRYPGPVMMKKGGVSLSNKKRREQPRGY